MSADAVLDVGGRRMSFLDLLQRFAEPHGQEGGIWRMSDLHLKVGEPPCYRIDNHLVPLDGAERITREVMERLITPLLQPAQKVKELVRLAQEQGYLTYNDINDALPDHVVSPEELDDIYSKLRRLEIEIVDQAEVDRVKQPEPEEEEEKNRLDILDDPVRMHLKPEAGERRASYRS